MRGSGARWRGAGLLVGTLTIGAVGLAGAPAAAEDRTAGAAPVDRLDRALDRSEPRAAVRSANDAYAVALRSHRWETMIAAGDTYRRLGEALHLRGPYDARARGAYLLALFRARREGSLPGMLRTAEAFATLGDREVVEQCLRSADALVQQAGDPEARARLRAIRERLVTRSGAPAGSDLDPLTTEDPRGR